MVTTVKVKNDLCRLLGITLFIQALTSLVAGAVLYEPLILKENMNTTMRNLTGHTGSIYGSVLLQILTALVIIVLGIAMYLAAGHMNKVMAMIALSFYLLEAVLLVVSQVFVFSLVKVSQLYSSGGDSGLVSLAKVLLICRDFTAQIAIIPFGLGALLFYYLLMKAQVIQKWLAIWGLATVPFVLVGVPLMAFGVDVPFALFVPYVPFEFFTGIYLLVSKQKSPIKISD